jgi:transposase
MNKRRTFSAQFKAQVALQLVTGDKGLMEASREYQIKDTVLSRWKQELLERAPQVFELPKASDQAEQRIEELERLVGRLTLELDIAKKVLGRSNSRWSTNE